MFFGADEGTYEPLLRERLCATKVCGRKKMFSKANIKDSRFNLSKNLKRPSVRLGLFKFGADEGT